MSHLVKIDPIFPLFETICIERQKIKNIRYHQVRYERSLREFYGESAVKIHDLFSLIQHAILTQPDLALLTRCRVDYNATEYHVQFFPYERRVYKRFQLVESNQIDYRLKWSNREQLNQLFARRGDCDEIIIIRQGKVTDCSIGNLIFRKDQQWFTPDSPLLAGTQRQLLLDERIIEERPIFTEDLGKFDEIRVINAMNGLA